MIKWIKTLFRIVRDYDNRDRELAGRIDDAHQKASAARIIAKEAEQVIRERTTIDVDPSVTARDLNYVFVAGRYRNGDYVQLYSIRTEDFRELIEILRDMQSHAKVKRLDNWPVGMARFIKRDLDRSQP